MKKILFFLTILLLPTAIVYSASADQFNPRLLGISLGGGNQTYLNTSYLSPIKMLNPKYIRLESVTGDYRKLYNPETGLWDFSRLDKEVERMQSGGGEIIANVFYTPRFLSSCPEKKYPYCKPSDMSKWAVYLKAIAEHLYTKYNVKYWEIGNEPSGKRFYNANLTDFFNFYIVSAKALKSVNEKIKTGGFGDNPLYYQHYVDFVKAVEKNSDGKELIDFITIHWYSDWSPNDKFDEKGIYDVSMVLRQKMKIAGYHNTPVFLTEWNIVAESKYPVPENIVASYFMSSLYWINKTKLTSSLFFRVEPYGNTGASLFLSGMKKTDVFNVFTFASNSSSKTVIMNNDDGYLLLDPSSSKALVTLYENKSVDSNNNQLRKVSFDIPFKFTSAKSNDAKVLDVSPSSNESTKISLSLKSNQVYSLNFIR